MENEDAVAIIVVETRRNLLFSVLALSARDSFYSTEPIDCMVLGKNLVRAERFM